MDTNNSPNYISIQEQPLGLGPAFSVQPNNNSNIIALGANPSMNHLSSSNIANNNPAQQGQFLHNADVYNSNINTNNQSSNNSNSNSRGQQCGCCVLMCEFIRLVVLRQHHASQRMSFYNFFFNLRAHKQYRNHEIPVEMHLGLGVWMWPLFLSVMNLWLLLDARHYMYRHSAELFDDDLYGYNKNTNREDENGYYDNYDNYDYDNSIMHKSISNHISNGIIDSNPTIRINEGALRYSTNSFSGYNSNGPAVNAFDAFGENSMSSKNILSSGASYSATEDYDMISDDNELFASPAVTTNSTTFSSGNHIADGDNMSNLFLATDKNDLNHDNKERNTSSSTTFSSAAAATRTPQNSNFDNSEENSLIRAKSSTSTKKQYSNDSSNLSSKGTIQKHSNKMQYETNSKTRNRSSRRSTRYKNEVPEIQKVEIPFGVDGPNGFSNIKLPDFRGARGAVIIVVATIFNFLETAFSMLLINFALWYVYIRQQSSYYNSHNNLISNNNIVNGARPALCCAPGGRNYVMLITGLGHNLIWQCLLRPVFCVIFVIFGVFIFGNDGKSEVVFFPAVNALLWLPTKSSDYRKNHDGDASAFYSHISWCCVYTLFCVFFFLPGGFSKVKLFQTRYYNMARSGGSGIISNELDSVIISNTAYSEMGAVSLINNNDYHQSSNNDINQQRTGLVVAQSV